MADNGNLNNAQNFIHHIAAAADVVPQLLQDLQAFLQAHGDMQINNVLGNIQQVQQQHTNSLQELAHVPGLLQQLVQGQQQLVQGQQQLNDRQLIDRARADARTANSVVSVTVNELQALPRDDGALPLEFPQTYQAFKAMSGIQLNALLREYGLPQVGLVEARRMRLAKFIGLTYV